MPQRKSSTTTTVPHCSSNKRFFHQHSLYNQLLLFGRVSPESVKLNSTRSDFLIRDHDDSFRAQRIEFSHTPQNTTITIKRSFPMLEDISKQDLFRWKEEFLQTAKLANWDDYTIYEVLKSSIDATYYSLIEDVNDASTLITRIFQEKYPTKHYLKYLNMLSNVRQDNFLTIKEYKEAIKSICARLRICMSWTEEQEGMKAEESFYHGLSQRTQLEMSRLNITTISGIYDIIKCTEDTLLEQTANDWHARAASGQKLRLEKHNLKVGKTCKLHGICKHTTEQCRVLNSEPKKHNSNTKDQSRNLA
ncbi:hypothetical protein DMUE_1272 [Dictyocoela muelleri]|nr:hypothetical protein DMUE_1272 [Dictyocoela muelleri]